MIHVLKRCNADALSTVESAWRITKKELSGFSRASRKSAGFMIKQVRAKYVYILYIYKYTHMWGLERMTKDL